MCICHAKGGKKEKERKCLLNPFHCYGQFFILLFLSQTGDEKNEMKGREKYVGGEKKKDKIFCFFCQIQVKQDPLSLLSSLSSFPVRLLIT